MGMSGIRKVGITLCAVVGTSILPTPARAFSIGCIINCDSPQPMFNSSFPYYHYVKLGENLWDITRKYHNGEIMGEDIMGKLKHYPTWIAEENKFKVSDYIHPGQCLIIPWLRR